MLKKVRETILKYHLLAPDDTVIVAVSGGPDSVALLTVLQLLTFDYKLRLVVAHLNHGLRPEAAGDELFVRHQAEMLRLPYESQYINVRELSRTSGKSLEESARDARYQFLSRVACTCGAQKIALGHHRQDQAETVLINLVRGSGPEGLKGMAPMRDGRFIRPLLFIDRQEIDLFLRQYGKPFVLDDSNRSTLFVRNRIRHQLLPLLRDAYNPQLEAGLGRTAEILRLEDDFMQEVTDGILARWGLDQKRETMAFSISELHKLHEAIQGRILKALMEDFSPEGKGIAYVHVMAAKNFLSPGRPAGVLCLPFGIRVKREYDRAVIERYDGLPAAKKPEGTIHDYAYAATVPGEVYIGETGKTLRLSVMNIDPDLTEKFSRNPLMAFMDYDRIKFPLMVRNIRPGDRIMPLGMTGSKKIKAIFINEKIPRMERRAMPLLLDSHGVLWIAGMRLSEKVCVTDKTSRILKAEII